MSKLTPRLWLQIDPEKQNKHDIFYDNVPILRKEIPASFFSFFSDWQAEMALSLLKTLDQNNKKRQLLAKTLLDNCNDYVIPYLPQSLLRISENTIYHFPINCSLNQRLPLLQYLLNCGIDSAGYGLNLCSEELAFKNFNERFQIAEQIKHATIFVPIHESYTESQMKKIASSLNSFFI